MEGAEDRVLVGMLASVDALAADAEIFVEVNTTWWSDPQLRPIDVLRPFLDRGFQVYLVPAIYWPCAPVVQRISALRSGSAKAVLEQRGRLDIVLSRIDADAL